MRLPDYHTHTARCGHAVGQPAEYVTVAKRLGLAGIGIADHIPLLPDADPGISMSLDDLPAYVEEVQTLKKRFPGYVFLGVEADYRPHTVAEVGSLLREHPFDYVIGSVHHLGTWGVDDERDLAEWDSRDVDDVWVEYLELVGDAADSGLFTILGHLDVVKKFGYRPTRTLESELDRLVYRIARSGAVVEINTAGLHKPVGEAYPTVDILQRLNMAGVPITFGSDAHRPDQVGRDFGHAVALARSAGYREFAYLEAGPDGARAPVRTRAFARETSTGGEDDRGEGAAAS